MTLIVEDGTIVTGADSYVDLIFVNSYNSSYVADAAWSVASDIDKEIAIRQATQYIDATFNTRWIGCLVENDQPRDWPRSGAIGTDGRSYDSDEIPSTLKLANSELAIKALSEPLDSTIETNGTIKKTKDVVGPIATEVEYFGASQHKYFTQTEKLLASLLDGSVGQFEAVRT